MSALQEKRHGGHLRQHRKVTRACGIGQRQRLDRKLVLPAHMQRRPAGHQHLQPATRRQQLGHHRGRGQQVLEVVEQQQHLPAAQMRGERLEQRLAAHLGDPQRPRDGGRNQGGIAQRGQGHDEDPVGVGATEVLGHVQGQTRLADPARAGQREQPHRLRLQQLLG